MKGSRNGFGRGLVVAAAVALAVGVGLLASMQVSAASGTVSIDSITVAPGEQGSADVEALGVTSPGLGAWEIDVVYNPAVVTAVSCTPQAGSVCNPNFASNTVRITGASASGLVGDTTLSSITFECDTEGYSTLSLQVDVFADATVGEPQPIGHQVQNGAVTCSSVEPPEIPSPGAPTEEEPAPTATEAAVTGLPSSGTGGTDGGALNWLIPASAAAVLAALAGFGALRLRGRHA